MIFNYVLGTGKYNYIALVTIPKIICLRYGIQSFRSNPPSNAENLVTNSAQMKRCSLENISLLEMNARFSINEEEKEAISLCSIRD